MPSFLSLLHIPDPATRHALTWHTFAHECIPPILCYYVTALLVIRPCTFHIRLALLPITLLSAFRCSTQVDTVQGYTERERLVYVNQGLLMLMTTVATRSTIWTLQIEPYRRLKHSSGNPFLDAVDLCFNLRGLGWSWSSGLKVPKQMWGISSTVTFRLFTFLSFAVHFLCFDFTLLALQCLGHADPTGASILSPGLTPVLRYSDSFVTTFLSIFLIYCLMQFIYLLLTLIAISIPIPALRGTPAQWAPLFHHPWFSTSLHEFWTVRWHQIWRHPLIALGWVPFSNLLGPLGGVMGAFLVSGILHHTWLWGIGRGTDFWSVVGSFLMVGVGTIAESAFKQFTGRRVGGIWGWAWTTLWGLAWGNMVVDAWLVRGLAESTFIPEALRPSVVLVRLLNDNVVVGKSLQR